MWFMSLPTIRGWFTDIQLLRGQDGIHIRESGLAALTSHLESASLSGGMEVSDGDGAIGGSTGITITRSITTGGITPGAERFTTGVLLAEGPRGRSMEIGRRHEDTLHHAARAAHAQAPSAATSTEDKPRAFPHGEGPALVAEEVMPAVEVTAAVEATVVVVVGGNRSSVCSR